MLCREALRLIQIQIHEPPLVLVSWVGVAVVVMKCATCACRRVHPGVDRRPDPRTGGRVGSRARWATSPAAE